LSKSYRGLTAAGTVQESSILKDSPVSLFHSENRKPIRVQSYTKDRNRVIYLAKVVIFAMHKMRRSSMFEKLIHLEGIDPLEFFGVNNAKMNLIKSFFPKLIIVYRGNDVILKGDDEEILRFEKKFHLILDHYNQFNVLPDDIINQVFLDEEGTAESIDEEKDVLLFGINGKAIRARTPNQKVLVDVCKTSDLIFAIGPAGTGKTYTAIALAVRALKNREIKRIILSRPAVEAGERLGFLPGDLKEKIDPYLQPLYDALLDMIPAKKLDEFMKDGTIQIAPLAFMRGRTLSNAFVILDEAQNTTVLQLKMFLTRMGINTKFVVTGDITQIDLPLHSPSGLILAKKILKNIPNISFVQFEVKDIVRHRLVRDIVVAYEKHHAHEILRREKEKEKNNADKTEEK
jgi:phosphate starvation-inducible PhoH-like protein